jgi:hypothetical protein
MRKSLLHTNHTLLLSLEIAVNIALQHCCDEERNDMHDALFWIRNLRQELDEPLLKVCKLSQILKCSNEYFEICDEKEELRKELLEAKNKVNILLVAMTASKLQALA